MTQAISPAAQLTERLSDALGSHDVDPQLRADIQQAYIAAGADYATWDDLPADVQAKIVHVESLPRTGWTDPSDVPDDVGDDW